MSQLRVIDELVWHTDFNSYLEKTRLIHEKRLGACYHEITQIIQFSNKNI